MSDGVIGLIIGIIAGMLIIIAASNLGPEYTRTYKQGQIDAINGKIIFELKTQEDGSVVWVRK